MHSINSPDQNCAGLNWCCGQTKARFTSSSEYKCLSLAVWALRSCHLSLSWFSTCLQWKFGGLFIYLCPQTACDDLIWCNSTRQPHKHVVSSVRNGERLDFKMMAYHPVPQNASCCSGCPSGCKSVLLGVTQSACLTLKRRVKAGPCVPFSSLHSRSTCSSSEPPRVGLETISPFIKKQYLCLGFHQTIMRFLHRRLSACVSRGNHTAAPHDRNEQHYCMWMLTRWLDKKRQSFFRQMCFFTSYFAPLNLCSQFSWVLVKQSMVNRQNVRC